MKALLILLTLIQLTWGVLLPGTEKPIPQQHKIKKEMEIPDTPDDPNEIATKVPIDLNNKEFKINGKTSWDFWSKDKDTWHIFVNDPGFPMFCITIVYFVGIIVIGIYCDYKETKENESKYNSYSNIPDQILSDRIN